MTIIEAVPNISEGRRLNIIEKIADKIHNLPNSRLLHYSPDASHNRTVFTLVGSPSGLTKAILQLYETTIQLIDLREHYGEHPRFGVVDVVPFVPIQEASTSDCIKLARKLGQLIATQFKIPIYLYEAAASEINNRALEDIRRDQIKGTLDRKHKQLYIPDFGPNAPHPTAGISAIGVRELLIAFNINLKTCDLQIAKQIAQTIRARNNGLPNVKAIGIRIADRNMVQVSINLTDYKQTPLYLVFDTVKEEAERYGVEVAESEIVGLVPARALAMTAVQYLNLSTFKPEQILESQLCTQLSLTQNKFRTK